MTELTVDDIVMQMEIDAMERIDALRLDIVSLYWWTATATCDHGIIRADGGTAIASFLTLLERWEELHREPEQGE